MILILTIPVLCQGSIGQTHRLDLPGLETVSWDLIRLDMVNEWQADPLINRTSFDLESDVSKEHMTVDSLNDIHGGIPYAGKPAPKDMASMMSFVWAEMFGGVDVVAELRAFAKQWRLRKNYSRAVRNHSQVTQIRRHDSRSRWSFVVACRIDEQTEVAASFKNRGRLFGGGNMALEINALDPMSQEVGLKIAYSDGDFDFRADRMTLTETAEAKLVVKF